MHDVRLRCEIDSGLPSLLDSLHRNESIETKLEQVMFFSPPPARHPQHIVTSQCRCFAPSLVQAPWSGLLDRSSIICGFPGIPGGDPWIPWGTDGTLGPMVPWDRWDLGLKDPRYFLRVVLSIPGRILLPVGGLSVDLTAGRLPDTFVDDSVMVR